MVYFIFFSIRELKKQKTMYLKKTFYHKINYDYFNIDNKEDLKNCRLLVKEKNINFREINKE